MSNLLFYGGSFNPIGNHHLILAQLAMEAGDYKGVVFLPCANAPHKADLLDFDHRYRMTEISTRPFDHFCCYDIEDRISAKGQKSYTYNLVRSLKEELHRDQVDFLVGSDCIEQLDTWYRWEDLINEVRFVVTPRHGSLSEKGKQMVDRIGARVTCLDLPLIDVSSTLVRERAKGGKSIRQFVPEEVDDYIKQHNLYR